MQRAIILGLVGMFAAVGLWYFGQNFARIPTGAKTVGSMWDLKDRIIKFSMENGRAPQALSELPVSTKIGDSKLDEWGHAIEYSVAGDVVSLRTLGKDGRIGGDDENADVVRRFPVCFVKECAPLITPWIDAR